MKRVPSATAEPERERKAEGDGGVEREREIMGFVVHNEEVVLLYSLFGSAPEMGQLTDGVRKTAGANMNEGNISYVCPCPWLASANVSPLRFHA